MSKRRPGCYNCGEIGHLKRECPYLCECGNRKKARYDKCSDCHRAEKEERSDYINLFTEYKEETPENISENPPNVIEVKDNPVIDPESSKSSNISNLEDRKESLPTMMQGGSNQDDKEEEIFAKAKKLYKEAMKQGSVEMSIIKCLVLGIAGVGKTHLKWLLLPDGINSPTGRISTGLADNPIQAFVGSVESIIAGAYDEDTGKWEVLDEKKLLQVLVKAYQAEKQPPSSDSVGMQVAPHSAHQHLPMAHGNADTEHDDEVIAIAESEVEGATLLSVDRYVPHMETKAHNDPVADKVDGLFINAFKDLIDKKVLNVKMNLVQFIDSGGQPQFVDLLPAFVQDVSAILFVVNLSEKLDHCPMIYFYGQDSKPVGKPYESPSSHKQVLEQSVRAAYARDEHPQVFIVGSHRDKEDEFSETRKTKNAMMKKLVNAKSLVMKNESEVIFEINGKTPNHDDQIIATLLRRAIVHHCGGKKKYTLPIKWFVLEMLIKHKAVQNILSFKECLEIANSLGVDEQDLEAALLHMVKYNLLLWYHKIMREIVFCDPQVILKIITDLVQSKHELDQKDVSGIRPEGLGSAAVRGDWCTDFRDRALINHEFLSHPHFQKRFVNGVFTAEHFIKLMCHLYIGVPLGSRGDYLMPALLDPLSLDDISKISKECCVVEPLLIHFSNKSIPYGMFSCLVAFLQGSGQCSLAESDGVPTCLHRNCVSFKCTKIPAKFTIIDSSAYIEVYHHSGEHHQACPKIQKHIRKAIEKCAEILNYSELKKLKYGFFCKYCHSVAQPYEESPTKAQCLRGCDDMDLTPKHNVWLEEAKDESQSSMTSCLGENDLFDVLEEVRDLASKWNALGLALRLQKSYLDTIDSKYPHDPSRCLTETLQAWLQQKYDVSKFGGPSWKLLCSAIEAKAGGNNPALAADIRSKRTLIVTLE